MAKSLAALVVTTTMLLPTAAHAQGTPDAEKIIDRPVQSLMTAATAYAAQLRLSAPAPRIARSLSGGQKVLVGTGIGFAVFAVPVAIMMNGDGHDVDEKLVVGVGTTGALLGAAIAWNLIH
jgi:hypothetical protein